MIRIILVAMTVILYLIFSVPLLAVLRFQGQNGPCGSPESESWKDSGGVPFYIEAGRRYIRGAGAGEHTVRTGLSSMWATTGATLTYWWVI